MQEHSTTVDGAPVRWLGQGTGMPVVLVHGIPTSPTLWRHVVPRLTDMRVLAFEMTGYGQSIPAGERCDISVGAQAERLLGWLDELGLERAVLVGHDLGGGGSTSPRSGSRRPAPGCSSPRASATTPGRSRRSRRCGWPRRCWPGCPRPC